jgi:hypothetical protein
MRKTSSDISLQSSRPVRDKICQFLLSSSHPHKISISISPSGRKKRTMTSLTSSYLLTPPQLLTSLQLPLLPPLPLQHTVRGHTSTTSSFLSLQASAITTIHPHAPTVISVQTFSYSITGPSLTLGYGVIIYDRYGLHQSYLQEFIDERRIDYNLFTIFEKIFPQKFNPHTPT